MQAIPKRFRIYYALLICYIILQLFFLITLKSSNKDAHTNAINVLENYKKLVLKINASGELDDTGQYKIVPVKRSKSPRNDVTIVSQCSSNHLPLLDDLFSQWKGPISVAIYSEFKHVPKSLWDLARFVHCYKWKDFAMKLVVPNGDLSQLGNEYGFDMIHESDKSVPCDAPYKSSSGGQRNYNWEKPFPVNLLRNVAKSGSTTDYILVIDIDMLPDHNLHQNFLHFLNTVSSKPEKTVYVVPVFETVHDTPMPRDKQELRQLVANKKAQPFYMGPCENCQKRTKYNEWLENRNSSGIQVLHKLDWKHPWEPFVITNRSAPNFDERFRQYGYNRVSQLCEIHMAGYDFAVLDNAFLVHKGYKKSYDFHRTKDEEMKSNRLLYNRFKFQIRFKYPDSDRVC